MAPFVVGIAGLARSGKDTAADILMAYRKDFVRYSFAGPLKEMLATGLSLTDAQLNGAAKNVVDPRYGVTPRYMMQTLGTEWGREIVSPDLWLKLVKNRVAAMACPVVIPDVRFEDEASFVRDNGVLLHIQREGTGGDSHASEAGITPILGKDIVICNNGTISTYISTLHRVFGQSPFPTLPGWGDK